MTKSGLVDPVLVRVEGVYDPCAPGTPSDWFPPRSLTIRKLGRLNRAVWKLEGHVYDRRRDHRMAC